MKCISRLTICILDWTHELTYFNVRTQIKKELAHTHNGDHDLNSSQGFYDCKLSAFTTELSCFSYPICTLEAANCHLLSTQVLAPPQEVLIIHRAVAMVTQSNLLSLYKI